MKNIDRRFLFQPYNALSFLDPLLDPTSPAQVIALGDEDFPLVTEVPFTFGFPADLEEGEVMVSSFYTSLEEANQQFTIQGVFPSCK